VTEKSSWCSRPRVGEVWACGPTGRMETAPRDFFLISQVKMQALMHFIAKKLLVVRNRNGGLTDPRGGLKYKTYGGGVKI